ncbi:UNVERIFIED_ORG: hypothetical protein [Escherichia phage CMSTMSU]
MRQEHGTFSDKKFISTDEGKNNMSNAQYKEGYDAFKTK